MISADFYPTTYNLINPVRQLTDNIEYNPDGTATDIELSDAYWLGWMKWETVPDCWKFSTYTQTADTLTIDFVTQPQNVNVGYVARRYTSAQTGRRWSNMYRRSGDTVSMYSTGYPNQYLNKYDIMGCASIRQFWVQIFAACEYKTSSSETTYINSGNQLSARYIDEFLSFFNGDSTLDFSLNVGSVGPVDISLDIANIEEDNTFIIEGTQGGYDYKIKAYFAFVCANTAPDVTPGGDYVTGATATNIIPMIGMTVDDDYYLLCGDTSHFTQVLGQIQIQVLANYVFNPNQMFNDMLVGGYKAEIDKNDFNSMAVNDTYFSGNTAFVKTASGNSGVLNRVLSPQEIMTIIGIMPRVGRGYDTTNIENYGYTEDVIWATYVTEDNEFTATLITGDLSDDEFKDKLRPWQYDVNEWAENDYTEEDLPPYEPEPGPGPTPQETEPKYPGNPTLGYSTRVIPKAGVNFYALNASLTSTFIQRLWGQPKNFYEAIQIAGQQVDSIFDYIQSFRFYPLNFDFSTSNIYPVIFGTGAVLKEADGNTNFQLSEATQIQHTVTAGVWNLSDPIYHWRDNFLDYSPYLKMSIYIPFAGTIELSPEAVASHGDISAATITLYASFDIGTGTITYYVANQANVLLAQKTVKIAIDLPLSGNNSAEQSAAILRAQFSTVKQLLGAGTSAATGAATSGLAGVASATVSTLASVGDMYLQNSLAQRAIPVEVQGMGGTFSALAGGQYPYITINRQKVSNPPNYGHTTGYLVEGTYKISALNGFTICRNTDVSGINQATDKEKAQIKQILESGFYA